MIPFKYIRFLAEGYEDRLKQKGVSGETLRYLESLKPADKGKAIAKLMSNPKLEIDDLKDEKFRYEDDVWHYNILEADPTTAEEKIDENTEPGDYYRIIGKWLENRSIILHEDRQRVLTVLGYYNEFKGKFKTKYISKYEKFQDLEQEYLDVSGTRSKRQEIKDMKMKGSEKLYDKNGWRVYAITSPEAACYYGKGTQWCTAMDSDDTYAKEYLERGPLYVFINGDGDKFQVDADLEYFMDEQDYEVDDDDKNVLIELMVLIYVEKSTNKLVEPLYYALDLLATKDDITGDVKGFFPEAQKMYLEKLNRSKSSPAYAGRLARDVLLKWHDNNNFKYKKEYEEIVIRDYDSAIDYRDEVKVSDDFKKALGKEVLENNRSYIVSYCVNVLGGERWKEAEALLSVPGLSGFYKGKQAEMCMIYAKNIMKDRWEEVEDIIKDDMDSYREYVDYLEHKKGIYLKDEEYLQMLLKKGTYADILDIAFKNNKRIPEFEEFLAKNPSHHLGTSTRRGFVLRYIEHFKVHIPEIYDYITSYQSLNRSEPLMQFALRYPENIMNKPRGDSKIEAILLQNPEYGYNYIEKYIKGYSKQYEYEMRSYIHHGYGKDALQYLVYYGKRFAGRWDRKTEEIIFDAFRKNRKMQDEFNGYMYSITEYAIEVMKEPLPEFLHEIIINGTSNQMGNAIREYQKRYGD